MKSILILGVSLILTIAAAEGRTNLLLLTADDMNHDSLGVTGCKIPNITPNLDRLAAEGLRFDRAHVTIAVCQPCRSVLMTGLFPHRNGAEGFEPITTDSPTLVEILREAGYLNGILGKVAHIKPESKFPWDFAKKQEDLREGRDPDLYYRYTKSFLDKAKEAGKPFFLMANSHDPHRPFPGSDGEKKKTSKKGRPFTPPKVKEPFFTPEEVEVPAFLPDIPTVRLEVAEYYGGVQRADRVFGEVLRALDESGMADNTIVMFLSDHGMAFPFAKTNCWRNSTKTPWIVRWPNKVRPGSVDRGHFVSGIDFAPTALEALEVATSSDFDGRSFVPLLRGEDQEGRESVVTVFHETFAKNRYEMRAIHEGRFGYIWNPWSDGVTKFKGSGQGGLTFKAMVKAANAGDEAIAERIREFVYRDPEEFYDYEADPDGLNNLIDDPTRAADLDRLRANLLARLEGIEDPLAARFKDSLSKN